MAASKSQIETIRIGYVNRRPQTETATAAQISKETVKRYYKKFREEGIPQNDLLECKEVILLPQEVKTDPLPRARDYLVDGVKTEVIRPSKGSNHTITKEVTISHLCRRLEDTEVLLEEAKIKAEEDPTLSYMVVKHNDTMLEIIKEMGRYCGLNKGTMLTEDTANQATIDQSKISKIKRIMDERPDIINELFAN